MHSAEIEQTDSQEAAGRAAVAAARRVVVKVGSSSLTTRDGRIDAGRIRDLVEVLAARRAGGQEVVLVSSGAVAAGMTPLGMGTRPRDLASQQAAASVGQGLLLASYTGELARYGINAAQVLLTVEDMMRRVQHRNAQRTLRRLLDIGALPIVNENDTVAVDELKVGDNDNLAAVVASLVDADVLLIATDIPGLYTGHPVQDPDARPLSTVGAITPDVMDMARGGAGELGTGGMLTKLEAASKAAAAGIGTALFNGRDEATIAGLGEGRLRGTWIPPHGQRLVARKLWLRHTPPSGGVIRIDEGAAEALTRRGASLLPGGVVAVEGDFSRSAMVDVLPARGRKRLARGLVQYASEELERIAGCHTREICEVLGFDNGGSVIHRDDLVLLDPSATCTPAAPTPAARAPAATPDPILEAC